MEQINTIAGQKNVERILAEASGISDPSSIAAGFLEYERLGLCGKAYLDSIVCVVDADRIYAEFLENDYPEEIIRAKGYLWFADDDVHVQPFEQAGRNASVTEVSNWLAAFPEDEQKRTKRKYPEIAETWDEQYGDRLNQIVFIGKNFDPQQVEKRLRMCIASGE